MVLDPRMVLPQKTNSVTRRRFLSSAIKAPAALLFPPAAGSAYAAHEAADDLIVTRYRTLPPHWPAQHRLTVTVVADLHSGGPNMGLERIRQVVHTANALNSDLIVLLGDYFATHKFITEVVPHPIWAAELARLEAPLGVYAVLGNHDCWSDLDGVRGALAAQNIPLLENKSVHIRAGGFQFWLAGLGDQLAELDDLPATLEQVSTPDPVLLLAHEPDIFLDCPDRVSLTIAGHTHGGQFRLPGIRPVWISGYGSHFTYGHFVRDGKHMIVSGGLGCSNVPLRLGVPPEIVQITLGA